MVEVQTVTIQLGQREYTIAEAPRLRAAPWRKRLMTDVKPLFDQVAGAQEMTFNTPADLLRLWPVIETLMIDGLDNLFELLLAYDAQLENDREYIEANATDKQILSAFGEVARFADPFGVLNLANRQIGRKMTGMSSN